MHRLLPPLLALVAFLVSLLAAELIVRALGHTPIEYQGDRDEKPFYRPHPRAGWVHVPGRYRVEEGDVHYLEDGSRDTGAPSDGSASQGEILLVGGSFTEGYNVDDDQTFAWKLQERFAHHRVRNFGTGGYGTLQALVTLEEVLPPETKPAVGPVAVVYGFINDHYLRNVAHHAWRRTLNRQSRGREGQPVRIPFALLEDGALRRFDPAPWPLLGLSSRSALVALVVDRLVPLVTREREGQMGQVGLALMEAMRQQAESRGAVLVVANLYGGARTGPALARALGQRGIAFVDCHPGPASATRWFDARTQHPTPRLHERYAGCIAPVLERALETRESGAPSRPS